ncbi:hypothetical protein LTS18_000868, partial [Coniosporium uncinatum]
NYFVNSTRGRALSLSPWGSGPEPADHEFMQRLFRKWDADMKNELTLQNIVSGIAAIKGSTDMMANIQYFFDLFDDDADGRIDREGILKISEALLFLSRRGTEPTLSPTPSMLDLNEKTTAKPGNSDEAFLSAISAFIRRCFEYADPDNQKSDANSVHDSAKAFDRLSTSSKQKEEDLLDMNDEQLPINAGVYRPTGAPPSLPKVATYQPSRPSSQTINGDASTPIKNPEAANLALDPSNPLHLTLPTFRMLVLADEHLEQFFDTGFPNSFRLSDAPVASSASGSLTTFSNIPSRAPSSVSSTVHQPVPGAGGVVAPGKGIRGMLDNIVTDGMRVAAEVRRRMDEASKELDSAAHHDEDDEDEDHDAKSILSGHGDVE